MIETILLAIPGFVLLWVLITYVEHLISLRKYPKGPFPLPLIGNILLLSKKPHLSFIELGKKYSDVFSLSMGMKRVVVVNSYHGIKEALVTRSNDFAGRPISGNIHVQMITNNGKGLTSSDYSKKWSLLRKVTYKSLHLYGSGMKNIEEIVIDEVEKMCSLLSKEIGRPTIIDQYIGGSLISTIHYICFNKKYHTNDDEFLHILKYMKLISDGLAPGQLISIFPWLRFFPDTQRFRKFKEGITLRRAFMHKMFEEHIASFNPEKIRDVTDNLIAFSQNKQLLESVEIQDWTQKDILEAVIPSLFFAAVETSLTTIRWCLIYLIRNPHVQTKIYEEILQNVGLKRQTEAADVDSLPFVQAVMLETNRRASILPINVPHKTLVDTSVVGKTVPKDTRVFFNLYSMHHDPTHWDEPEKFKPERWLNADGSLKKEKATHYLPFGAGIRVCLGERMAKMQMFLIVTRLLTNFEISLAPGETLPGSEDGVLGITLQPPPFKMILNTRKIE